MADQPTTLPTAQAGIAIIRVFQAPRELVWKEWTEPQRLADWFGGPGVEVPLSTVSIDLRLGGAWKATTLAYGPDHQDIHWEGKFLEIIEPQKLAFTICGHPSLPLQEVVTVILTDLGDSRTEMLFRQYGHRTARQYEDAREAWSVEFDRIAERLDDRNHGAG